MNYEEFKFTIDQTLPKDATPELIEKTEKLKESAKVFFDYQDFYCDKHNVSEEVFDKISETKTQTYAKEIMANEKLVLAGLTEDTFKEIIFDKMVDDVKEEGFDDIGGYRSSLSVITSLM